MRTITSNRNLPPHNRYSGAVIFLIDDEQIVVDTLTSFLQLAGFQNVHGFTEAANAISTLRYVRPDVIFTDIMMPGMDGNAVARMVRSFPHVSSVPIVAITADSSFETSQSIVHDGATSVLIKPIAREILVQRTLQVLDDALNQARITN